MIRSLPHIIASISDRPLLIAPAKVEAMLIGLAAALRARGSAMEAPDELPEPDMLTVGDPAEPSAEPEPRPRGYRIHNGVGVLPVRGVLVRRAGAVKSDSTPFQSYEAIGRTLRQARGDRRVRGILLDLDSPGGEAGGVFELARDVRSVGREKPVWAIANDDSLSAAYALAAAADRVWITETGAAGSIGVVAMHLDQSRFDDREGFKYSYIHRGSHKLDANPHGPLSSAASGVIQTEVDRLYDMLVSHVAEHRNLDPSRVRDTEAAVFFGDNAINAGLADRRGTLDEAAAALAEHATPVSQRRLSIPTEAPPAPVPPAPAATQQRTPPMESEDMPGTTEENVVHLRELAANAAAAARTHAGEVVAMCNLAGFPELAAEYIAANAALETVRVQLMEHRAATDRASRRIQAIDATQAPRHRSVNEELLKAAEARFQAQAARHP